MYEYPKHYDVIVLGAGHAGIEAALAAARMGCSTLLLSMNLDTIGQMSCNPAIGGLAKGHLVREIDALGGEMAMATDMTGLQFRMLNTRKGPSVWSPRAQCDKRAYQVRQKWVCELQAGLDVRQAQAIRLLTEGDGVCGVETTLGVAFKAASVVVTTGTFLRGLLHVGSNQLAGGRAGEAAATGLSASLQEVGLQLGRLKTGTPPRLLRKSIDFSAMERQDGDQPIPFFTHWRDELFHVEQQPGEGGPSLRPGDFPPGSILERAGGQLPCFLTHTTSTTAELIRANLDRSPLYSGVIEGIGPRYCPSIEDKVVKFPEKSTHQIFLEPEGVNTDEIYVNGFSTSMPFEVQVAMVRSIAGCERAEILRPAYAVEYDFVFPTQLKPSLETKVRENLFLAGQINGTSGYEEAAAQGLMAGINAALKCQGKPPVFLGRDQAYIGVLIDDLVTKGTSEPYRMFTSRAEYRLLLRQDNADIRLSSIGHAAGLLSASRFNQVVAKRDKIAEEIARLRQTRLGQDTLDVLLRRPEVSYLDLPGADPSLPAIVVQGVEIEIKYQGYVDRQQQQVERSKSLEVKQLPETLKYSVMRGLRSEAVQKLEAIRPATLGQAARIPGITPADIALVSVWLKRSVASKNTESPDQDSGE